MLQPHLSPASTAHEQFSLADLYEPRNTSLLAARERLASSAPDGVGGNWGHRDGYTVSSETTFETVETIQREHLKPYLDLAAIAMSASKGMPAGPNTNLALGVLDTLAKENFRIIS